MDAIERFLHYVTFDTRSQEEATEFPSTAGQWRLARQLYQEMRRLGLNQVTIDEYGYVFGTVEATVDKSGPVLGLLAHLDTAPVLSGANVQARRVLYHGGDLALDAAETIWLRPAEYPELTEYQGQELIVTDGSTLLGADDKAGIAEILTAAEYLLAHPELPHGRLRIGFTPDEEIGLGPSHFDVAAFGADLAYTVDGGRLGELEYENFNAAAARVRLLGHSVHPGAGRGRLRNAALLALEFQQLLPVFDNPACTDGRQGFYHLTGIEGCEEAAELRYIIRDHSAERFAQRLRLLEQARDFMNAKWGEAVAELEISQQYRNMAERIAAYPQLIDNAKQAFLDCGVTPLIQPIRGGTDGAQLSFRGLPCPNLSSGAHAMHSRCEFIPVAALETMSRVLVRLAQSFV